MEGNLSFKEEQMERLIKVMERIADKMDSIDDGLQDLREDLRERLPELRDRFFAASVNGMLAAGEQLRKDFMKAKVPEETAYAHYAMEQADAMLKEKNWIKNETKKET